MELTGKIIKVLPMQTGTGKMEPGRNRNMSLKRLGRFPERSVSIFGVIK